MDVMFYGILSNEESLLPANSMLIMDILVQMKDGSITNVEIQKKDELIDAIMDEKNMAIAEKPD